MKNSTKILLFVLIVTVGIFVIDSSLSASTSTCYCVNQYEAAGECINICWDTYQAECLELWLLDHGCQYGTCLSTWKFSCDNGAKGYIITEWDNCWDCYI